MPQKGGRPKGAARCHPRTVEIKLPAAMRDAAAWRESAARSIEGALAFLDAAEDYEAHPGAEHVMRWSEELTEALEAPHLLIEAGVDPARMRQALLQLKEKLATANFDSEGNVTLRASTTRGPRGEASSQELVQALSLLPGSYNLFYYGGSDLFAAAAPTAESYADLVLSLPKLADKARSLSGAAEKHFLEQERLISLYSRGEISLAELHESEIRSSTAATKAYEKGAGEVRAALARIPGGTRQRQDILDMLNRSEREASWMLGRMFVSDDLNDVIDDALGWSAKSTSSEYGEETDSSGEGGWWESPLESRTQTSERGAAGRRGDRGAVEGEDQIAEDQIAREHVREAVREYVMGLGEEIQDEARRGLRMDRDSDISTPGAHTNVGALLPLIHGYVEHMQPPGLDGNEDSSRKMARAMLEAVRESDHLLRFLTESRSSDRLRGSEAGDSADQWKQNRRDEYLRRTRDEDVLHTRAPYLHDGPGPYQGVTPAPLIVALAPYLDSEGALELSGAMRLEDGWEEKAALALQDTYDVTPKVARAHVQAAAAKLLPADVPAGEDLRIVGQARSYAGFGPRRLLARLPGGELLEAVNEVAPSENGLEQLMVTLRIGGKKVASEPGAGLEDVVRRYAAERRAAGA